MKKHSQSAVLFLILVVFLSCERQVNCPAFNSEPLEWMPYQEKDIILLVNTSNDSLLLAVNEFTVEHTTHYMTNLDCGTCDDRIMINGSERNNSDLHVTIGLNKNKIIFQEFIIKGSSFTSYDAEHVELANYTFERINYDALIIIDNNNTDERFQKLVLAKGYGIIALVDKEGKIWKLKDTSLKSSRSVEIKNISCE